MIIYLPYIKANYRKGIRIQHKSAVICRLRASFLLHEKEKIYEILQKTEMPAKLVRLIKEGRNNLENNLSEKFSVFKGIRQSDTLSKVLLNITLDHIIKKLMPRGTITSKMTQICTYADNVVIMARKKKQ
jgi:hypothetical protein